MTTLTWLQSLLDSRTLLPQHVADLQRSGISESDALDAGFRSVVDHTVASALLNWKKPSRRVVPAMAILFHDRGGNLVADYIRLKPDTPRKGQKGEDKGKFVKYESPVGKSNRVYFPPGVDAAINDPAAVLLVTEGEKKSLKATLEGLPTIGLVGVWGWQQKRDKDARGRGVGERKLIPDLLDIVLKGRLVVIVFDSDAAQNPKVQAAERALAEVLKAAGAEVKIVRLPAGPDGQKVGLDDYLVAHPAADLRKLIDETSVFTNTPGEPGNDSVIVLGTDEHRVNDETARLLANDPGLFQAGHQLVRVLRDESERDEKGVHRPAGPRIEPLPLPALRDRISRVARFVAVDQDGVQVPKHPPAWCVAAVAARGSWRGVRPLDGVVPFPVVRPDGSVLSTPGFDPRTRLYLEWPFPPLPLPDRPARADAVAAAEALLDVVAEFPFQAAAHRAAWLAGLLTPLARSTFDGPVPLFLVDANVRASGKGKLLDALAMIVLGTRMVIATYPREEDELRKKITACIVRGDRLVLLDNLTGQFGNGTLDALLTSTHWRDRILGESRMYDGPALATWFATGNNVAVGADTARRICHVRLESDMEKPEERDDFRHPDLLAWVAAERPRLLAAALTVLRAYILAGKPDQKLKAWGSYEAWSGIVRNCLAWIGQPDPGETRLMVQEQADTTAASMRSLLTALNIIDPERVGLTAAEIFKRAYGEHLVDPPEVVDMLKDALDNLLHKPDARLLGFKLRHHKRRIFDGRYLDAVGTTGGSNRWAAYPANLFRERAEPSPSYPHVPRQGGTGKSGADTGRRASTGGRGDGEMRDILASGRGPGELFGDDAGKAGCPPWKM